MEGGESVTGMISFNLTAEMMIVLFVCGIVVWWYGCMLG